MKKLTLPKPKTACLLLLLFALVVILDRWTKCIVLDNFSLHELKDFIPGILRFTYEQNTGGAFSAFSGAGWLFFVIVPVAIAALVYAMLAGFIANPLGIVSCVCVISGAVGNLIDRIVLGYVVDMIDVYCIRFAVFNVADCFITVGCILLCISLFLPEKKSTSKE